MKNEVRKFMFMSFTLASLMLIMSITILPLVRHYGTVGAVIWGCIAATGLGYSIRVELFKKSHGLRTYSEIKQFMDGEKSIEKSEIPTKERRIYETICKVLWGMGTALIIISFIK